jgi:hypothetical protein
MDVVDKKFAIFFLLKKKEGEKRKSHDSWGNINPRKKGIQLKVLSSKRVG